MPFIWWLVHVTGSDYTAGYGHFVFYDFVSGFGSDLGEYVVASAIIASTVAFVRHHQCEVHKCYRLGRHTTAAGHKVCRKHHPDDHLTAEQVVTAHKAALVT